jgi:hypothetical protein
MKKIMLEIFVLKYNLHVYQNLKCYQRKIFPEVIQNLPPKKEHFLVYCPPPNNVLSLEMYKNLKV